MCISMPCGGGCKRAHLACVGTLLVVPSRVRSRTIASSSTHSCLAHPLSSPTMAEDDYEATLLVVRECFVYRVPPRTQAKGFKAADWDLTNPLWQGRTRVVSKGPKCIVKLEDPNNGEVFAQCFVDDTSVEPVTDSSRYFVLKIEDGSGK